MITFSINLAFILVTVAILAFIFNRGKDLITLVIALELILLSVGILLVSLSFHLDDLVGSTLTLYLLPLAGCESAIALALLVAYYPIRGTLVLK
uniref:NADH-ubiquinone oxidoreductase chain 4L n=1 Tax=Chytriomyces confervae TaxID=246404 RepID=A0A4V1F1W2_9FUNG|nr:NADH dehydrogenase subunit 4L [Chytriomyces confervae]QCQ69064.1 NADH dehydrogenase subunit 4L [Chytriomyces confervae]